MSTKFAKKHDIEFEFKIKRHSSASQFKNLWDLEVKVPGDDVFETIVDADSLSMAIDKIGYILERNGF